MSIKARHCIAARLQMRLNVNGHGRTTASDQAVLDLTSSSIKDTKVHRTERGE